ncbi:MAG TPA: hypothetical protein VIF37_10885 [Methylobacter sp.]|jgi:hypothetical protein
MRDANKITRLILVLVSIWMVSANFVSWKATFLASSDIGSTMLVRLLNGVFSSSVLSTWYRLEHSLKKEDVINRLTISKEGALLTIPLNTKSVLANIDSVSEESNGLLVSGWIFVSSEIETAKFVIAVIGESIVGVGEIGDSRADVAAALNEERAVLSGFSFSIPGITEPHKCNLKMFALTQAMHLYQIPFYCEATGPDQVK